MFTKEEAYRLAIEFESLPKDAERWKWLKDKLNGRTVYPFNIDVSPESFLEKRVAELEAKLATMEAEVKALGKRYFEEIVEETSMSATLV
jgi:DNA mismatch repair ATPase MutS